MMAMTAFVASLKRMSKSIRTNQFAIRLISIFSDG
jgi:hypothetical protein